MSCPKCDSDRCLVEFGDDGEISKLCLDCETKFIETPDEPESHYTREEPAIKPVPAQITQQKKSANNSLTAGGVVKLARTELKELDKEIKRLEGLKKRRDEIARLLNAAKKPRPCAVVKQLRANSGD